MPTNELTIDVTPYQAQFLLSDAPTVVLQGGAGCGKTHAEALALAARAGVDPALALQRTNDKFAKRFMHVEKRMKEDGLELSADHMARMDGYWEEAKKRS